MATINPTDGIIAVVTTANGDLKSFLGTGFFIGDGKTVVTAKHVVVDTLEHRETVAVAQIQRDGSIMCCDISVAVVSDEFDVAVLKLDQPPPNRLHFSMSREPVSSNLDVVCVEYSQTIPRLDENGKRKIVFNTLAHKGNVLAH